MRSLRKATEEDRGVSAIEFALVLLPLITILLGIVEFGRAYSMQLQMQHAAREVAREVALHYDDPGPVDLDALTDDLMNDLIGGLATQPDFAATIVKCSLVSPVPDAVVTFTKPVSLAIPLTGGSSIGTITLGAKAQMPCEG